MRAPLGRLVGEELVRLGDRDVMVQGSLGGWDTKGAFEKADSQAMRNASCRGHKYTHVKRRWLFTTVDGTKQAQLTLSELC